MTNIYLITNLINNKKYVGKTVQALQQRFNMHCVEGSNKNCFLHNAIKKYGRENFKIELLERVEDDCWVEKERFYIKLLNTHYSCGGYNISWGGDYNPMQDPIARQHHKEAMKNRSKESFQTFLGHHHSKESISKQVATYRKRYENDVNFRLRCNYASTLKRQPVNEIDKYGNVICQFKSLADAARSKGDLKARNSGRIKQVADKFNKNGTRKKFLGSYWSMKIE